MLLGGARDGHFYFFERSCKIGLIDFCHLTICYDTGDFAKVVIMLKVMAFLNLTPKNSKSWARKRPAISECKLRLKKVVIDEI